MTSINIIARNNCKLNVNISGNYQLALTGVTGPYNIVLLKANVDFLEIKTHTDKRLMNKNDRLEVLDWYLTQERAKPPAQQNATLIDELQKAYDKTTLDTTPDHDLPDPNGEFRAEEVDALPVDYVYETYRQTWRVYVSSDVLTSYSAEHVVALINDMFEDCLKKHTSWKYLIQYIDSYSKFEFSNCDILSCSDAFSYLLGIPTTGYSGYSETIPIFNGTPYLFLRCNKLNCPLRYCWQTNPEYDGLTEDEKKKKMYSGVHQILSVSPNNNYINQPFSMGGGQLTCNGNDLTDVEFTITGIHGEEIEFASDLLWTFELTPVPDEDFSNLPGLLPPEAQQEMAQAQGQEGEQPPDGQPQQAQQEQAPQEQATNAQQEEQVVKPSSTGLMKNGLPRIQNIQ